MKHVLAALLLASGVATLATSGTAAPRVDIRASAPQPIVEHAQSERLCRRLRRDCVRRDGIGDRRDCRRYRRVCERWWR
jgi:hypothetical protein